MDIAVVDDEKAIREHICGLVEERQPESRIEAYATGGELLASGKLFDIVFLDIQMEGMNGIETARGLREKQADTVLVFVTGIEDYVFDAFDLYAFQYLLKPIDENKFAEVLERAVREVVKKKERRVLFIKSRNLTLDQSEILYIESRAKKVEIHTAGAAQAIEIYAAMDELEGQLGENFYRCHRAYIVNMDCITEYDGESITLTNGDRVYLTKKKYGEFFLVVSFQALLDISRYAAVILLNAADGWAPDIIDWCAAKRMFASEESFGIAVKAGVAGTQFIQYASIALLLYFSLRKIVRDFREKDYFISRTELLFILTRQRWA